MNQWNAVIGVLVLLHRIWDWEVQHISEDFGSLREQSQVDSEEKKLGAFIARGFVRGKDYAPVLEVEFWVTFTLRDAGGGFQARTLGSLRTLASWVFCCGHSGFEMELDACRGREKLQKDMASTFYSCYYYMHRRF